MPLRKRNLQALNGTPQSEVTPFILKRMGIKFRCRYRHRYRFGLSGPLVMFFCAGSRLAGSIEL
jgi:hypothetical protein